MEPQQSQLSGSTLTPSGGGGGGAPASAASALGVMWRSLYARVQEMIDASIQAYFGNSFRGGKFQASALTGTLPPSVGFKNPMTTSGDLITGGTAGVPARLGIGANTQVLTSNGTAAAWATPTPPGMTNPMTQPGDLIAGGTAGAPGRLASTAMGRELGLVSGAPYLGAPAAPTVNTATTGGTVGAFSGYATVTYVNAQGETTASANTLISLSGSTNVITIVSPSASGTGSQAATAYYVYMTKGDGSGFPWFLQQAAGSPTPLGTNYVMSAQPNQTGAAQPASNTAGSAIPAWIVPPTSGLVDPMTTRGDLIARLAGGTGRLALGASGYVLTSNGTDAVWAAATGGFTNPMTTLGDTIIGGAAGAATRLPIGTTGQVLSVVSGSPAWAAASGGGGSTSVVPATYSVILTAGAAVTDSSTAYDMPGLSIANVPVGTYHFSLSILAGTKSGGYGVNITDGSNTNLWPTATAERFETFTDSDGFVQMVQSGIFTTTAAGTVKVRAAASAAVGNYTVYDRQLTLLNLSAGGGGTGGMVPLQEIVLTAAQATIAFSSIPATYRNLRVTWQARTTSTSNGDDDLRLTVNGDTAAHYLDIYDAGNGSSALSGSAGPVAFSRVGHVAGGSSTAGYPGNGSLLIPNYTSTVFDKTWEAHSYGAPGLYWLDFGGLWQSTVAINALTFALSAGNFAIGTVFTLWADASTPSSGTGSVNKVQLDYQASVNSTVSSLVANTWTTIFPVQSFNVDLAGSIIEVDVGGFIQIGNNATSTTMFARLIVDSTTYSTLSGTYIGGSTWGNALSGASTKILTGLSVGSHTINVQFFTDQNTSVIADVSSGVYRSFAIRVLERKQ